MKQSNWVLGIGIAVAIILIAGAVWMEITADPGANSAIINPLPDIGQSVKKVVMQPVQHLLSLIIRNP